jgi:hypothetical protein
VKKKETPPGRITYRARGRSKNCERKERSLLRIIKPGHTSQLGREALFYKKNGHGSYLTEANKE